MLIYATPRNRQVCSKLGLGEQLIGQEKPERVVKQHKKV